MKIKKEIKILIAVIVFIMINLIFMNVSNAAIESKLGTTVHKTINVNDSFQYCYDMRYPTSSLGNNSLDPHLITAADWGGVAYLGLSSYGAVNSSIGPTIIVEGKRYTTTTGNASGVFMFGATRRGTTDYMEGYTQTASYLEGSTPNDANSKLYEDSNARLVSVLNETNSTETNKGMAYAETSGWYSSNAEYQSRYNPIGTRLGVFGYRDQDGRNWIGNGYGYDTVTYRPAIWN